MLIYYILVYVKPYIPQNWHPDYRFNRFVTTIDTTGFVLDTTNGSPSIIYRHKPVIEYPAVCRVIPETQIKWRNYEYSGTIIKPEGYEYDDIEVGAVFYIQEKTKGDYYRLVVRGVSYGGNGWVIMKGDSVLDTIGTISFQSIIDTMLFAIKVETEDINEGEGIIVDGIVLISAKVWKPGGSSGWSVPIEDMEEDRKIEGHCGIIVDNVNTDTFTEGIKIKDVKVKKLLK